MRWWEYASLFSAIVVAVALSGLVGAWAAERRLDRVQERELDRGPVLNPQKAEDQGGDE